MGGGDEILHIAGVLAGEPEVQVWWPRALIKAH
jgi:hypothetical protein